MTQNTRIILSRRLYFETSRNSAAAFHELLTKSRMYDLAAVEIIILRREHGKCRCLDDTRASRFPVIGDRFTELVKLTVIPSTKDYSLNVYIDYDRRNCTHILHKFLFSEFF